MNIGQRIQQRRKELDLSADTVADYLKNHILWIITEYFPDVTQWDLILKRERGKNNELLIL